MILVSLLKMTSIQGWEKLFLKYMFRYFQKLYKEINLRVMHPRLESERKISGLLGYLVDFSPQAPKLKIKSTPKKFLIFSQKKYFLYFEKWNFLALRLKDFLCFLRKKCFLYFEK